MFSGMPSSDYAFVKYTLVFNLIDPTNWEDLVSIPAMASHTWGECGDVPVITRCTLMRRRFPPCRSSWCGRTCRGCRDARRCGRRSSRAGPGSGWPEGWRSGSRRRRPKRWRSKGWERQAKPHWIRPEREQFIDKDKYFLLSVKQIPLCCHSLFFGVIFSTPPFIDPLLQGLQKHYN